MVECELIIDFLRALPFKIYLNAKIIFGTERFHFLVPSCCDAIQE